MVFTKSAPKLQKVFQCTILFFKKLCFPIKNFVISNKKHTFASKGNACIWNGVPSYQVYLKFTSGLPQLYLSFGIGRESFRDRLEENLMQAESYLLIWVMEKLRNPNIFFASASNEDVSNSEFLGIIEP